MMRFKYTVEFWVNLEKVIERGYIIAEDFKDAMERLERYYGEDEIIQVYICGDSDNEVIVLEENMDKFNTDWEGPALNLPI